MIRRRRRPRNGNKEKQQCHMPRKTNHADRNSSKRYDVWEQRAEIALVHEVAEDRLQHIRRHRRDHYEHTAHGQRQIKFQDQQRQKDRQEIRIEIHHRVPRREQCRRVPYFLFHAGFPLPVCPFAFSAVLSSPVTYILASP